MRDSKSQLKLEDIIDTIGIENLDVTVKRPNFVEAITDIETIQKFNEFYNNAKDQKMSQFLLENKDSIDNEKFIFIAALNYRDYIEKINTTIEQIKKREMNNEQKMHVLANCLEVKKKSEKIYKKIIEKGKNIVKVLTFTMFDPETSDIELEIVDSREVFTTKKLNKTHNQKRLDKIDQSFKDLDPNNDTGLEYIFKKMVFTDMLALFSVEPESKKTDEFIGQSIISCIQDNALVKNKITTIKELQSIRMNGELERYFELVEKLNLDKLLPKLKELIRTNAYYLDIDKMLLVGGFRYQQELEENNIEELKKELKEYNEKITVEDYFESMKRILELIKANIKDSKTQIDNDLQFKIKKDGKSDYDDIHVNYNLKDLDETISRFIDNKYISRKETNEIKKELLAGNIFKSQIDSRIFDLINLSNEEIETMMDYSLDNFIYGADKLNYSLEQIIQKQNGNDNIPFEALAISLYRTEKINFENILDLYVRKLISAEFFKKFSEETNISSEISLNTINQRYLALKKSKEVKNEETEKLDAIIDIYKILNIDGKSIEEQEEASNEVMYQIAEDFEDEEDILFYYNKGLVTLGIVAEWCGESTIEKLYNESKISKEDLINLSNHGKISGKFVEQILLVDDMQYDELMDLIIRGSVSEQKIVDLYMQGKIFDVDFDEMLNNGIISHEEYFTATELRTQEKLEENSKIKLAPILKDIPDKKSLLFDVVEKEEGEPEDWFTGTDSEGTRNVKSLIDPGVRYEFFKMLGAMQAEVLDIDETNAFYNYEFFVIPNSNGEIDLESVVIAERFYVNKETKDRFATDNATYFFQYKDLMVNSNMSKNEMTKERDKIVFRASHRRRIWAVSVLQKLAQTMLSTKFKECTTEKEKDERAEMVLEQLHRILTPEQIKDILDLTGEIDDEEKYTYEIIDGYNTRKDSNKKISDEGFGEL